MSKYGSYAYTNLALAACAALMLAGCPTTTGGNGNDGGHGTDAGSGVCTGNDQCPSGQTCQGGVCTKTSVCQRDSDCQPGQTCNVLTGKCEGSTTTDGGSPTDGGPTTDGGGPTTDGGGGGDGGSTCTPGLATCTADGANVQTCASDGLSWQITPCSGGTPSCYQGACVACTPGTAQCNGSVVETCKTDGSGYTQGTDCSTSGGTCTAGACQVCTANTYQCKDATTSEMCNPTGTGWVDTPCTNGTCDSTSGQCVASGVCTPGSPNICQGDQVMQCKADGSGYTLVTDCAATGAKCQAGACVDLCAAAAANNSYIGCEYWPVVLTNTQLDPAFHSQFALVVSNPNSGTTANLSFYQSGNATAFKTDSVAGGQIKTIMLPWNAMDATTDNTDPTTGFGTVDATTQKGAIAYKMTSSAPVTVYQFNPLSSALPKTCSTDFDCPNWILGETCSSGTCSQTTTYSYTNDASLLLPAHIFGSASSSPASTYVAMTVPHAQMHIDCQSGGTSQGTVDADSPSFVAIVATQDATNVTINLKGAIAAGGGLPATPAGQTVNVTLNTYDVLQLASSPTGTPVTTGPNNDGSCDALGQTTRMDTFKEYPNDLTGSVISADKPIAVYSGADCRFMPYNKWACDHMEQQLFPFQNWGDKYIGSRAKETGTAGTVGDIWRIVASQAGTNVTFDPASVHAPVTLGAGQLLQFTATTDFMVQSQDLSHPILVSQFFQGEDAHSSTVGDPTMILAIPVEQYRSDYAFSTPSTIAQDYMNIVRPTGTTVTLDGTPVTGTFTPVGSSGFEAARISIQDGAHHLSATNPVGLTVYGYDSYVSYGYPGGLDLNQTVVITPGG